MKEVQLKSKGVSDIIQVDIFVDDLIGCCTARGFWLAEVNYRLLLLKVRM
jgi:hypothetical protein